MNPEEQALFEALGLPERFTPITFVGTEPVRELGPEAIDLTLAHELGHAMGLPHVEAWDDLMSARVHRCVPHLRAEQASELLGYARW